MQNDSNTPLHLLQPAYNTPYGPLTTEEIKEDLDRVLHYLEQSTPTRVVSKTTGEEITDYAQITTDAQLERGAYRLASYEWGVTYSAMLTAAEATGDEAYYNYVADRFKFLAAVAPHFRALLDKGEKIDGQMRQILTPHALDDAGAVCAAMIKAQLDEPSLELNTLIAPPSEKTGAGVIARTASPTVRLPVPVRSTTPCGWTICSWASRPLPGMRSLTRRSSRPA